MLSRRVFVQHGITASVTVLVGGPTLIARANASEPSPDAVNPVAALNVPHPNLPKPHLAIFDHRFAAGRRFASSSEASGVTTRPVTSDVTDLWYSELHPLWTRQPVALAGLTTYGPLFCLERLAWNHGMRVLHREEHGAPGSEPNQPLFAWLIAPRRNPSPLEPPRQ
ncbi:MAG TPA: hypothetical protein VGC34_16920 [Steroidobacteraceae bacterium]